MTDHDKSSLSNIKGTTGDIRVHVRDILAICKTNGVSAVEINAGEFKDSYSVSTHISVVCDVLREFAEKVVEHPLGESGCGRNMTVRIKL